MLKLVLKGDSRTAMEFPVTTKPITIGRGEGNTLLLKDASVSLTHAKVTMRQDNAYIKDLQSTNGVFVNGEQISSAKGQRIFPNDEIKIGMYTFALETYMEEDEIVQTVLTPPDISVEDEEKGTEILPLNDDKESEDRMALEKEGEIIEPSGTPYAAHESGMPEENMDPMSESATILMGDALTSPDIPKLVITKGPDTGKEFLLDKGLLIIGRSDDNDIVLNDKRVSRGHHAKLILQNDRSFVIEDLNSTNGIFIRGEKIERSVLSHDGEIQIGETFLKYINNDDVVDLANRGAKESSEQEKPKKLNKKVYVALPALILATVFIYFISGKVDERPVDMPVPSQTRSVQAPVDIAVPVQTQPVPQEDLIQKHLEKGIELINSRSWIEAIEELNKIIDTDQQNYKAKELIDKAEKELVHKNNLDNASVHVSQARYKEALKALKAIPADSVYFDTSGEETRRINNLIIQAKRKQKAEVRPGKKKAISLLKEIQADSGSRKKAVTLTGYIQQAEKSFQLGTTLYNNNDIDGAVNEWKKTLLYEKELPINKKSWYAKMIAGTAADEFYRRGLVQDEQGNHDAAVTNWVKALSSDPTHKRALSKLESLAAKLYKEGNSYEGSDKTQAVKKWKEILTIVPPGSRYYKKATAKLEQK
jgi:pSer/pThr/pTyr-binding forkhead associated (FHA) protein